MPAKGKDLCRMRYYVVFSVKLVTSRLAQLVERVTSNDEVSRSSRLMGTTSKQQLRFATSFCFLPVSKLASVTQSCEAV